MTPVSRLRTQGLLACGLFAAALTGCGAGVPHRDGPATGAAPPPAPAAVTARDDPKEAPLAERSADPDWKLVWSPSAKKDKLGAFEGIENRGDGRRIFPQGDDFRVEMKVGDRDGDDRQRNEVKGMRTGGRNLTVGKGQTWRFTYRMFVPKSLRATTSFTHIMQMKRPGQGSAPIVTLDLRRHGDADRLELVVFGSNTVVAGTDLDPLRDKWIGIDARFRFDDGHRGNARLIVTDGRRTVVDGQKGNVNTWLGDRVRPKWGIYRSLRDRDNLRDTFLLLTDMKAFRHT